MSDISPMAFLVITGLSMFGFGSFLLGIVMWALWKDDINKQKGAGND